MAVISTLTTQGDYTGELPVTEQTGAMWRFNEAAPDANTSLADTSGKGRKLMISGWNGTTASLIDGRHGRYIRINTNAKKNKANHADLKSFFHIAPLSICTLYHILQRKRGFCFEKSHELLHLSSSYVMPVNVARNADAICH